MDTNQGKTIDDELVRLLIIMEQYPAGTEKYLNAAKAVEILCQARSHAKASTSIKGIPIEAIIAAVTNIFGIMLVLNYEKINIITSKSFGMIFKGRNI
jgi:hypothetical protein